MGEFLSIEQRREESWVTVSVGSWDHIPTRTDAAFDHTDNSEQSYNSPSDVESDTISLNLSSWFQPSVIRAIIVSGDVFQRGIFNPSQPLLQSVSSAVRVNFLLYCSFLCFFHFSSLDWRHRVSIWPTESCSAQSCVSWRQRFDGTCMTQISHLIVLVNSTAERLESTWQRAQVSADKRRDAFMEKSYIQSPSFQLFLL